MKPPARPLSSYLAPLLLAAGMLGAFDSLLHRLDAAKPPREPVAARLGERSFAQIMTDSMSEMTQGAMTTPMAGNPDRDFAAMMIVHHLGAVEMARAELLYGKDPVLRRLAEEIVVTQSAEIAVMRGQLAKAADFCR
jgi:uncharacterized protein (DUF305 family)